MGKRLIGSVGLKPGTDTGFDLDTKGQIHGYSDTQFALPVGSNDQIIYADSSATSGLVYGASAKSILATTGDILGASGANTLTAISASATSGHVLTSNGAGTLPTYQAVSGDANLEYIGEVKLGSPASFIEQATGFDDYSNVMMFFNLAESGTGTFIPMCQFYVGGSLATGTSYGTSEIINGGSIAKTNATTKVMLDGNSTANNSCTGYLSFFTGSSNSGAQQPSDYTTVQGQYQLGLGSTSNAPDTQVQVCAKYTGIIEGCRITNEGTSANFGTNSAIKMFGVTY